MATKKLKAAPKRTLAETQAAIKKASEEAWQQVEFPAKMVELLFSPARYKVAYGGRGGSKSWAFARALLILGRQRKLRILCARETQNSIAESVHQLLSEQIIMLGLAGFYTTQKAGIYGANGTEFIFAGLRNNVHNIKSLESVDIVWVEEAHKVSKDSWETLIPTIRKDGSEIWVSFNPNLSSDNTYQRFVMSPPPNARVMYVSYRDNPWFPKVLEDERVYLKAVDPDAYDNVWEGKTKSAVSGAIYKEEIRQAELEGRICVVPYASTVPVYTFWDLGFADRVSIWFAQVVGMQWRVLDYYANSHKKIDFYLQILQSKRYTYHTCVLPWDGDTPELGSGKSIAGQMRAKGFRVQSVRQCRVHVGIEAVRSIFSQLWFDLEKCTYPPREMVDVAPDFDPDFWGLSGLRRYQWGESKPNQAGVIIDKRQPLHDLASHPADALRTMALFMKNPAPRSNYDDDIEIRTTAWS